MLKRGYDILSWIWLALLIILFVFNNIVINSAPTHLLDEHKEAIDSGNFSEMRKTMDNLMNEEAFAKTNNQANIIKYILYGLGAIYSVIIFILCFKLKAGTLEKLIALIGGFLTYGLLAILVYFFDVRKKFDSGNTQDKSSKRAMYIGGIVVVFLGILLYFYAMSVCPDLMTRTPEVCDGFLPFLVFIAPGLFILILAVIFHILYNRKKARLNEPKAINPNKP